jgi:CDP-diacylglycerol--serine O-phosphatidyltransferase
VARLTRTQSAFGAEYDSLSDMVSFGAAPALIAYEWAMRGLGKWGWIAAFIYCAGAALRLARFNTNLGTVDKRYFQGLPSPAAAALVAGLVWVTTDNGVHRPRHAVGAFAITLFAGLTMVSNVKFWSGKDINLRRSVPFIVIFGFVLAFVAVSVNPPVVLFGLFVAYALSGYVMLLAKFFTRKSNHPRPERKAERLPSGGIAFIFEFMNAIRLPSSSLSLRRLLLARPLLRCARTLNPPTIC